MSIAIASGKGGTGKTTVASGLALSLARQASRACKVSLASPLPLLFLDCDVEAPNAHIFLKPQFTQRIESGLQVPVMHAENCSACGRCAEVCQFNAIAVLGNKVIVFEQLCHGCGSCTLNCPENAITEAFHPLGVLEQGETTEGIHFARGVLNVGEPMAVPIIRHLKEWTHLYPAETVLIDASPGTSCPVVEAIRQVDYLLLVTEPTPFGLHDLRLAVDLAHQLNLPCGVIINRDGVGDHGVEEYCNQGGIPVFAKIPYNRRIAEGLAQGHNLIDIDPRYGPLFLDVYSKIQAEVSQTASRLP